MLDNASDLKVLARMTNLVGQSDALATFSEANFTTIPEPSSPLLVTWSAALWAGGHALRRRRARR